MIQQLEALLWDETAAVVIWETSFVVVCVPIGSWETGTDVEGEGMEDRFVKRSTPAIRTTATVTERYISFFMYMHHTMNLLKNI